mmetsp:Transcript_6334/g.18799  ORF Transcript_6334/g.18799 Transcript_6334/m.18799 type:complete len:262 (+) Transcript_6334:1445-2230(+)
MERLVEDAAPPQQPVPHRVHREAGLDLPAREKQADCFQCEEKLQLELLGACLARQPRILAPKFGHQINEQAAKRSKVIDDFPKVGPQHVDGTINHNQHEKQNQCIDVVCRKDRFQGKCRCERLLSRGHACLIENNSEDEANDICAQGQHVEIVFFTCDSLGIRDDKVTSFRFDLRSLLPLREILLREIASTFEHFRNVGYRSEKVSVTRDHDPADLYDCNIVQLHTAISAFVQHCIDALYDEAGIHALEPAVQVGYPFSQP